MIAANYPSPVITAELPGSSEKGTILIPKNEEFRIRHIFEDLEYRIPPQYLPSGTLTIVDIGANVGLFALYMKEIRPDCDIHCFEPVAQTQALLKKNIEVHQRITIHPYALSNFSGNRVINIHAANSGENSLKFDAAREGQFEKIRVLDAAAAMNQIGLTYIDIMKIDTEGCEVEILESLQAYLPYVGIIMTEYHTEDDRRRIDDLLHSHVLFDAKACETQLGLGIFKYINSRLI